MLAWVDLETTGLKPEERAILSRTGIDHKRVGSSGCAAAKCGNQ